MLKKALIIEDDQKTALQLSNLIEKETSFKAICRSDLDSIQRIIENDQQIKLVVSLYEVSNNEEQERDSRVRHLIETYRADVEFLSAATLNNRDILLNDNKVVLLDIPMVKQITKEIENEEMDHQQSCRIIDLGGKRDV